MVLRRAPYNPIPPHWSAQREENTQLRSCHCHMKYSHTVHVRIVMYGRIMNVTRISRATTLTEDLPYWHTNLPHYWSTDTPHKPDTTSHKYIIQNCSKYGRFLEYWKLYPLSVETTQKTRFSCLDKCLWECTHTCNEYLIYVCVSTPWHTLCHAHEVSSHSIKAESLLVKHGVYI